MKARYKTDGLFEWDMGMEFSPFVDAVLRYVYGTIVPHDGSRIEHLTWGRAKHFDKESFSARVARVHTIRGAERSYYYVGLSAKHSALKDWKVDWATYPILEPLRPPTDEEIIWLEKK